MPSRPSATLAALLVGAVTLTLTACAVETDRTPPAAGARGPAGSALLQPAVARTVAGTEVAADDGLTVQQADLVVPPAAEADAAPTAETIDPAETTIVADARTDDGRVETAAVDTSDVQTIGVTWPLDADATDLAPRVRTETDGVWSQWEALDDSDIGPDPGTPDAQHMRAGTDSYWIGDADSVQLSFAATSAGGPADMNLTLVGSDEVQPADAVVGQASTAGEATIRTAALATTTPDPVGSGGAAVITPAAGLKQASLPPPVVITRATWGAAPQVCAPDVAPTLVGAVVHHTAGSNTYSSVAEAMQQIRGDQAYHINGRGWCDLGYNFIVDKWGNIYEGRAGSLTQAVIGVHAGGFNTATVGVSMLGDFSGVAVPPATRESVAQIIGYRLGAYGRDPAGPLSYLTLGGENSRFPAGTWVPLPTVFGHRDVAFTACPGNQGYSALPGIRARARGVAYAEPLVRALYRDMLQREPDPTGLATWSALISAGQPPSVLADGIGHSREFVQRRVADAYQQILRRAPDPTGLEVQTQAIMNGLFRVEDLRGQLIASPEYFAASGGTVQTYVSALYRDVLGRGAAPSEVEFWSAAVSRLGLAAAPRGIWKSLESAQLRVNETFLVFLSRPVDSSGLGTWPTYWMAHGDDGLRAAIVSSDEYLGRSRRF